MVVERRQGVNCSRARQEERPRWSRSLSPSAFGGWERRASFAHAHTTAGTLTTIYPALWLKAVPRTEPVYMNPAQASAPEVWPIERIRSTA